MRACHAWVASAVTAVLLAWCPSIARSGDPPWSYVLPVDHGIRADRAGKGHFLAPRYHGKHNGLDILAPIGTPVLASCSGMARGGSRGSFGNWVHLVCKLPSGLSGGRRLYASLFHAHMQKTQVSHRKWAPVSAGDVLGTVGKTGNAIGASVMPHVHLEIIVHRTEEEAKAERHSGRNHSNTEAADYLVAQLQESCLDPRGIRSRGDLRRARRLDPFLVLICADAAKPSFSVPEQPLTDAARRWSSHYRAKGIDLDGRPR